MGGRMGRLDARAEVNIPAKAQYFQDGKLVSSPVTICDMSLGGALIKGLKPDVDFVRLCPERRPRLELQGEIVRKENDRAALKLFFSSELQAKRLWEQIRTALDTLNTCPYCGDALQEPGDVCADCGNLLDFSRENYLTEHLLETLLARIQQRVADVDNASPVTLLHLLDREVLNTNFGAKSDLTKSGGRNGTLKTEVSKIEKEMLLKTLAENGYNISRTARTLQISRPSVYALMKKHHIQNRRSVSLRHH